MNEQLMTWPGWENTGLIGRGSFGSVYRIERTDEFGVHSEAALKTISIPHTTDEVQTYLDDGNTVEDATEYFRSCMDGVIKEFDLMSKLRGNSNIVSYEDHMIIQHEGGIGWDVLIRMELLTSLPVYLRTADPTEEDVVRLGCDICRALELCAVNKIVHRDIKPENIFVSKYGDYKLGDFGIARTMEHTMGATRTGTYSYMAPEVYRGEDYNAQVDLYSLGTVLYWLLNERRLPFMPPPPTPETAAMREQALRSRLRGDRLPPPKNGSEALKACVLKACAFEPAERYKSAEGMHRALVAVSQGSTEATVYDAQNDATVVDSGNGQQAKKDRPAKPHKKKKTGLIIGAAAAVLLLAAAALFVFGRGDVPAVAEVLSQSGSEERKKAEIFTLGSQQFTTIDTEIKSDDATVDDLSPLASCTELTHLEVKAGTFSDLSPLSELTQLDLVELSSMEVTDLSPLAGLTNLLNLFVYGAQVSDLTPVQNMHKLHALDVQINNISDLSPLAGLDRLDFINAGANPISDLSPLAELTGLKELYLHETEISDISPLAGLTKLRILYLDSDYDVTDVSPLAGLTELTELHMWNCQITDATPLYNLKKLKVLDIGDSALTNIQIAELEKALPDCEIIY